MTLIENCYSEYGRHDFVQGSKTSGPNVFYNCTAINSYSQTGPHHRFSVGTLFDNIRTNDEAQAYDRGNYGSGHGWSGATIVYWNSVADRFTIEKPASSRNPNTRQQNYAIGCIGKIGEGRYANETGLFEHYKGYYESQNIPVDIQSLFKAQLKDRLGSLPVYNISNRKFSGTTKQLAYKISISDRTINIQLNRKIGSLISASIYSTSGRMILQKYSQTGSISFTQNSIPSGIYLLQFKVDDAVSIKKIIFN